MIKPRAAVFASGLLGCLLLCASWSSVPAWAAEPWSKLAEAAESLDSESDVAALSTALDRQMKAAGLGVAGLVQGADIYGQLLAAAREQGASAELFSTLFKRGEGYQQLVRGKVRALERDTQDRETALEHLYRSDQWHDINYALSAFSYWRAWAMLGLGERQGDSGERRRWLNRAEHGFQSAAVRILYPGIVYGSWLGLGYVAQARDEPGLAEQRFRRLQAALASDPDNPLREIAGTELTLLAIAQGKVPDLPTANDEPLSPTNARVYAEHAFVLLERHRQIQSGAIEAGQRIKALIDDGYLNDGLVARIMAYRDEIAGQDLGLFSLYVDAEYAFAYQQNDTAVLKYRDFVQRGGLELPINLRVLQYHHVVALLNIRLPREAWEQLEQLRLRRDLPPDVAAALPKLAFLVAQARHQRRDNQGSRRRLQTAAEGFIRARPGDKDVASAHLALAQLLDDPAQVKKHLQAAGRDKRLKGSIALGALQGAVADFNRAVSSHDVGQQRRQAQRVSKALGELPRQRRRQLWFKALNLQVRAVLATDESQMREVLAELDELYQRQKQHPDEEKHRIDENTRQVLVWTRVQALDGLAGAADLRAFVAGHAAGAPDAITQKIIYQRLIAKETQGEFAQLLELADAFYPALKDHAQDRRQLRRLQIRAASGLGDHARAYELSQAMVAEFPRSGDAWLAYARSAEASHRYFAAGRAWAKISQGQPQGSPRWRQAMAKRIGLLRVELEQFEAEQFEAEPGTAIGASVEAIDRGAQICALLAEAWVYRELYAEPEQQSLEEVNRNFKCGH